MLSRGFFFAFALSCLLTTGCSDKNTVSITKHEAVEYGKTDFKIERPVDLDITNTNGNIEVYSWDKDIVTLETKKRLIGMEKTETLEKKLGKLTVQSKKNHNRIEVHTEYGSGMNSYDKSIDLRVFIPKGTAVLKFKLKKGDLKCYDDIKGLLNIDVEQADVSINRFEGKLKVNSMTGNVRVDNGIITGDTSIVSNHGNIYVKAAFINEGSNTFETSTGNIDLILPADGKVTLENIGRIDKNDFVDAAGPTRIKTFSGMGKISVVKW